MNTKSDLKEKAQELYLQGLPASEIANKLGLENALVRQWSSRHKWPALRAKLQGQITASADSQSLTPALLEEVSQHKTLVHRTATAKINALSVRTARNSAEFVQQANALKILDDVARRNLGLSSEASEAQRPAPTFNFNLGSVVLKKKANVVDVTPVSNRQEPA